MKALAPFTGWRPLLGSEGLGVVENRAIWENERSAGGPDRADSLARESWFRGWGVLGS